MKYKSLLVTMLFFLVLIPLVASLKSRSRSNIYIMSSDKTKFLLDKDVAAEQSVFFKKKIKEGAKTILVRMDAKKLFYLLLLMETAYKLKVKIKDDLAPKTIDNKQLQKKVEKKFRRAFEKKIAKLDLDKGLIRALFKIAVYISAQDLIKALDPQLEIIPRDSTEPIIVSKKVAENQSLFLKNKIKKGRLRVKVDFDKKVLSKFFSLVTHVYKLKQKAKDDILYFMDELKDFIRSLNLKEELAGRLFILAAYFKSFDIGDGLKNIYTPKDPEAHYYSSQREESEKTDVQERLEVEAEKKVLREMIAEKRASVLKRRRGRSS